MRPAKEIEEAMDVILNSKMTKPTIPLSTFVSRHLPILAHVDTVVDLSGWLAVAGNAMQEVDVVHPDGTLAYVVPPIMNTPPTRLGKQAGFSTSDVVAKTQAKMEAMPAMGEKFFNEAMPKLIRTSGIPLHRIKQWNAILSAYGYPTISLAGAVNDEDVSELTGGYMELDCGYEDF